MQYVVIPLLILAILYYAWPLILALLFIFAAIAYSRNRLRRAVLSEMSTILPYIEDSFSSHFFVGEESGGRAARISNVIISGVPGFEALRVIFDEVYWDESLQDELSFNYRRTARIMPIIQVKSSGKELSADSVRNSILSVAGDIYPRLVLPDTLDAQVSALVFKNYQEAVWGDEALTQIGEALGPLRDAYATSLSNELLVSNSHTLLNAVETLQKDARVIGSYVEEAYVAIRKCFEFLVIPVKVRGLLSLDTASLETFSRKEDMRRAFDEVVSIKRQYDLLVD
jgi:hypothetical protein